MKLAALASALLLAACSREPARQPAQDARPGPVESAAAEPVDMAETDVETTISLGGPEIVTAVNVEAPDAGGTPSFRAGAPLIVTVESNPLPAGAVLRLLLRKGSKVVETQKLGDEGSRRTEIRNDETNALEPGAWMLEVWLGGDKVHESPLEVTGRP